MGYGAPSLKAEEAKQKELEIPSWIFLNGIPMILNSGTSTRPRSSSLLISASTSRMDDVDAAFFFAASLGTIAWLLWSRA